MNNTVLWAMLALTLTNCIFIVGCIGRINYLEAVLDEKKHIKLNIEVNDDGTIDVMEVEE